MPKHKNRSFLSCIFVDLHSVVAPFGRLLKIGKREDWQLRLLLPSSNSATTYWYRFLVSNSQYSSGIGLPERAC